MGLNFDIKNKIITITNMALKIVKDNIPKNTPLELDNEGILTAFDYRNHRYERKTMPINFDLNSSEAIDCKESLSKVYINTDPTNAELLNGPVMMPEQDMPYISIMIEPIFTTDYVLQTIKGLVLTDGTNQGYMATYERVVKVTKDENGKIVKGAFYHWIQNALVDRDLNEDMQPVEKTFQIT